MMNPQSATMPATCRPLASARSKRATFYFQMEWNMTMQVNDVDALKAYLQAAVGRAKHHPGNVDGVILALTGASFGKKKMPILLSRWDQRETRKTFFG
jgi:hypothetical protein